MIYESILPRHSSCRTLGMLCEAKCFTATVLDCTVLLARSEQGKDVDL